LLSLICGILIMPYEAVNFTAHLFWWWNFTSSVYSIQYTSIIRTLLIRDSR
jgi:hypothetical protein